MRTEFNWLHLTDLHFGHNDDYNRPIRSALLDDLKTGTHGIGHWDLVILTGDLTHSGATEQFGSLDQFLSELLDVLRKGGPEPIVLAVPGNHDVTWLEETNAQGIVLQGFEADQFVRDLLWNDSGRQLYREQVNKAFENYTRWWEQRAPRDDAYIRHCEFPGDFSFCLRKNGTALHIVGLNTATLRFMRGRTTLGPTLDARQYERLVSDRDNGAVSLLLTHYPPLAFGEHSRRTYEQHVYPSGVHAVHLCGHLHTSSSVHTSYPGEGGRRIWQGQALFGYSGTGASLGSDRCHGYAAGSICIDGSGTIRQWPRSIVQQDSGSWKGEPRSGVSKDKASEWTPKELLVTRTPHGAPSTAATPQRPPATANTSAVVQLAERLQKRYGVETVHIALDPDFDSQAAEALEAAISEIAENNAMDDEESARPVAVGVVCGKMTSRIIGRLAGNGGVRGKPMHVRFVALNKAAVHEAFQYSANYLATSLAISLNDRGAVASSAVYTHNAYDKEQIDRARKEVDIILCSAGARHSHPKSYLEMWHGSMTSFDRSTPAIPEECVGDFCLTPIDDDGRASYSLGLHELLQKSIDAHPQFRRISDLIRSPHRRPRIIVPLNTERNSPTGKEAVARAVLKSGAVDVCVVAQHLAESLDKAVGGFLLKSVSARSNQGFRRCWAHDFRSGKDRAIVAFDPRDRLSVHVPGKYGFEPPDAWVDPGELPQIILSENSGTTPEFDWNSRTGTFPIAFGHQNLAFTVPSGVRQPGIWSLVLQQLARSYLRKATSNRDSSTRLWDVGCGCGVVGILASLGRDDIQVSFSDVSRDAVECARDNSDRLRKQGHCRAEQGSLLDPFGTELFDAILFNPPFLPRGKGFGYDKIDGGGERGFELASEFAQRVRDRLAPGGVAIVGLADYVDQGDVHRELAEKFGHENVVLKRRAILYPIRTDERWPRAYEVEHAEMIEEQHNYRFERLDLGGTEFVAFEMRHYVARLMQS